MGYRTEHEDFEPVRSSDACCEGCAFSNSDTCGDMACTGWDFPAGHPLKDAGVRIIWVEKQ
ncbi:hypothetical protein [Cupriavidus taiwanensis]|uniref:hypothetical protein n=1 Tax=Cupriavidus taiwanensis TaxID=164546 RepID=UPI000E105D3D|nr:hypothetical protein [Cupriavidus taiwanensis]SPA50585.1 protein of unknown function [Cupriavidus taiwanensis]